MALQTKLEKVLTTFLTIITTAIIHMTNRV